MLPRHLLFAWSSSPLQVILLALATAWCQSPQHLFDPEPDWGDSVSIRQRYEGESLTSRSDFFVLSKNAKGLPLRIEARATDDSGSHLSTYEFAWGDDFPSSPNWGAWPAPRRFVHSYAKNSVLQHTDTTWSTWDPLQRTLISTSSRPRGACRWSDSARFDARNRLVYQQSCWAYESDTTPRYTVYRAGYEQETDSFPRWAVEREVISASYTHVDSMFSVGPANRPDSLWGTTPAALVWSSQGRLLARRPSKDPDGGEEYAYDPAGRLIREIRNPRSKDPDTTLFLYAWEASLARRAPLARSQALRLTNRGLLVDLLAPDRISVEVVGFDGARRNEPSTWGLPVGRSILPLSVKPGDLVRVVTARGTTVFVAPAR